MSSRMVSINAFFIGIVSLIFCHAVCAQGSMNGSIYDNNKLAAQITRIVSYEKEQNHLQSVMVGVWVNDREILTQAFGNSITGVPATKEMHFRIGAVTISYLTTLLLQLVDEQVVSLDDKLSKWFPRYPHSNDITLRMLANSTAGYQDYVDSTEFAKSFPSHVFYDFPLQKYIDLMIFSSLKFSPGNGWDYSHTNFVILGQVLEKVTGQSIQNLLQTKILNKWDLNNTKFPSTPDLPYPVLHAFTTERGVYEDSTYWNPSWTSYSGLMVSNLEDLGKWTRLLGEGKLISSTSYQAMLQPLTAHLGICSDDLYYGLGVFVANAWIMQDAKFGGYNVTIAYSPSKKIAINVITTLGENNSPDTSYSKKLIKKIAQYLASDQIMPERM